MENINKNLMAQLSMEIHASFSREPKKEPRLKVMYIYFCVSNFSKKTDSNNLIVDGNRTMNIAGGGRFNVFVFPQVFYFPLIKNYYFRLLFVL